MTPIRQTGSLRASSTMPVQAQLPPMNWRTSATPTGSDFCGGGSGSGTFNGSTSLRIPAALPTDWNVNAGCRVSMQRVRGCWQPPNTCAGVRKDRIRKP